MHTVIFRRCVYYGIMCACTIVTMLGMHTCTMVGNLYHIIINTVHHNMYFYIIYVGIYVGHVQCTLRVCVRMHMYILHDIH